MRQLPSVVWIAIAGFAALLVALCILTWAMALRIARRRWTRWPRRRIVALLIVAVLPWLVAWLAPIRIVASIDGTLQLIGWLVAVVLAFALLVLLPLTAVIAAAVWWKARRAHRSSVPPVA